MRNQIVSVQVERYPMLRVVFADGFGGEIDIADDIARLEMFAPLRDRQLFAKVGVSGGGYRLGWKLDDIGNEIDYSSETIRNDIETARIRDLAKDYRAKMRAAE